MALLVGGTLFAPFAAAAGPGQSQPKLCGVDRGGWESIDVPFTGGSQSIKSWSISQSTIPIFATNGLVVMRSTDRGCNWQEAWRLDSVPQPGTTVTSADSVIEQVHVSESPLAPGKVFVTVDQLEPVSRPRVFVSNDGGESFSPSERGLEAAVGRPEEIATSRSNPGSVFLLTDTTGIQRALLPDGLPQELTGVAGVAQALYESIDGGRTWQPTDTVYPGDPWNGIEVDPVDADQVWVYGDTGAAPATTVGAEQPRPVPGPISYVDVWHQPGQPARVLATTADGPEVYRSNTGGREFVANPLPGIAQSVVSVGPLQEIYSTTTGVYFTSSGSKPVSQSPADGRPVLDLYLTDGAGTELWGRSDSTIERKVFRPPTPTTPGLCDQAALLGFTPAGCAPDLDIDVPCVEAPKPGEAALQPEEVDIALKPGQKKTVHYDFHVPLRGQLLDVFFLIDVSGSMQDAIDGTGRAMTEIVTSLRNKGIDVRFGVGEYRSYSNPPVYRRVLDITNDCGRVEEALESLIASGGGEETQLEALYQVARGESRPGVSLAVPAGQDASFRADSTRIIIHTTDETITEGPPNPSMEEVADALNAEFIDQVGVAIEDSFGGGGGALGNSAPPSEGLAEIARRTETFAPEGGVDCNGDGVADIAEGEALVCKISPLRARNASAMAPAITNMVEARIPDPEVSFGSTPDSPVILEGPPTGLVEDVADPAQTGFDVTYSCPELHAKKRFEAEITATVDGTTDAVATATVLCKVPPKPEPPDPIPFVALPVIPFLPPPPAPPEIPPAPNPNPNPQPNPQAQGQAQAQGAMAHQEQQQPQLAYVHAQHERAAGVAQESAGGKETEYAMSSYSKDSDGVPPEAIFMIGAMTMSAAFGCLTLAREKVRVQHVRR